VISRRKAIKAQLVSSSDRAHIDFLSSTSLKGFKPVETVAMISADGGETFGPVLALASNGTLTVTEEGAVEAEGGGEEETTEEEAVGGAEVAE
jgi:hypothetical protein